MEANKKTEDRASAEKTIDASESSASQEGSGCRDVTKKDTLEQEGVSMAVATEKTYDNNSPPNKANSKVTHEAAASSAPDPESGAIGETTGVTPSGKRTKEEDNRSSDLVMTGKGGSAALIKIWFSGKQAHPVIQKHNNNGHFWVEKRLKQNETLNDVRDPVCVPLGSSRKGIRDALVKHFNLNKEAKDCFDMFLSKTGKKESCVLEFSH